MALNREIVLRTVSFLFGLIPIPPVIYAYMTHIVTFEHFLFHVLFGIIGMICAVSVVASRRYLQVATIVFVAFTILGLVSQGNLHFIHLHFGPPETIAHAIFAAANFYFGFIFKTTSSVTRV